MRQSDSFGDWISALRAEAPSGTSASRLLVVLTAVALVALLAAHLTTIDNLLYRWGQQLEYSHGYFIPLISAWMLWRRRSAIAQSMGAPSWGGAGIVLAGILLLIAGELTTIFLLNHIALVVALFGLVACIGGFSLVRVCFVPLLFLFFMIPLPYFVATVLTWKLQILSSQLGVFFIRLFDIPVYLEGNVIDLGAYKLGVVEACSGLRYLIPLLSLGFLGAYMFRGALWKKAVIFLSVIPITILMNSARIGVIGVLHEYFGVSYADGFLHFFEGWVVFLACLALLFGVMALMAVVGALAGEGGFVQLPDIEPVRPQKAGMPFNWHPLATAILVLGITAVGVHLGLQKAVAKPERAELAALPYELGPAWQHKVQRLDADVAEVLGADDYLVADLRNGGGDFVNLYIAYLDSQRDGRSWHSPRQCIPGGGWRIVSHERKTLNLGGGQPPFAVNRIVIRHNTAEQLVYYWYQQRGRRIPGEWTMKAYLIVDALTKNRTDGALVRLVTPILPNDGVAAAEARLTAMARTLAPILPAYIPE